MIFVHDKDFHVLCVYTHNEIVFPTAHNVYLWLSYNEHNKDRSTHKDWITYKDGKSVRILYAIQGPGVFYIS